MAIFKRGKKYWYHFIFNGRHIQESTKQGNPRVARQMEAAHRTALAKGEVGIRDKQPIPSLADFIGQRFEPWAKATFEQSSPKTWQGWYRAGLRALCHYQPLSSMRLSEITGEGIADFAAHRQTEGLKPSSVNANLRVLRRVLRTALEWGVADRAPRVKLLRGERHRERVVTPEEEESYLGAADAIGVRLIEDHRRALEGIRATQRGEQPIEPRDPYLLRDVTTVLLDSGLRPEECFRLRWEAINWRTVGKAVNGTLLVTHGKTAAARRFLPMTPRVRFLLETRWEMAGKPAHGWVWPAPTKSGHAEPSSLKKQHRKAVKDAKIQPFVLYSLRHTFLTRLGESGCDAWTLARIAGHSSIAMSARYVHPSEDAVLSALSKLEASRKGRKTEGREAQPQLPPTEDTVAAVVATTSMDGIAGSDTAPA